MSMGFDNTWEPGTYEVTVNKESTTVEVDNFRYGGKDGNTLEAVKNGNVVATWQWWDSIVKKD